MKTTRLIHHLTETFGAWLFHGRTAAIQTWQYWKRVDQYESS